MSFVAAILDTLREQPARTFLQEAHEAGVVACTGRELLDRIDAFRAFVHEAGLARGDRCALLANNSIDWVAADVALMAEGILAVPLYSRQSPTELVRMIEDARPAAILGGDPELLETLDSARAGSNGGGPRTVLLSDVPDRPEAEELEPPAPLEPADPVSIFYTSGTSGEPKGVVISAGNVAPILSRASERLDELMRGQDGDNRVYHYLPFCFAGSWIMLLLCLTRGSLLTLNTDLARIVEDLGEVRPHYFQNVPVVLDRVRGGVVQALARRGTAARALLARSTRAVTARAEGEPVSWADTFALRVARRFVFPAIRKKIGPDLRALICGSAPLSRETQLFFETIELPLLQVYGLTETTAICTMDRPGEVALGCVGRAIEGVEMRLGADDEILVRGPNVFSGYWNRPDATAAVFEGEWLRTGDRGETDERGNWRIVGRLKNLIVPASGHNVAPEPLEERLRELLPQAAQIVVFGSGRPHLGVVVTGAVGESAVHAALVALNEDLPHYQRVRTSLLVPEPFTSEMGLITANGKLKRDAIVERLANEIDRLYERDAELAQRLRAAQATPKEEIA